MTSRAAKALALFAVGLAFAGVPLCPFAAVTGVACPSCGLTRAALALVSMRPEEAVAWHPLAFVALPMVALGIVRAERSRAFPPAAERLVSVLAAATLALLLGVWCARHAGALGGLPPVTSPWLTVRR